VKPEAREVAPVRGEQRIEAGLKPMLPRMRQMKDAEIEALAALRGLSVEGVRLAAQTFRRVGLCRWPLYMDKATGQYAQPCAGKWEDGKTHWFRCNKSLPSCAPVPAHMSWVVTDEERWVAQFRRLDGGMYDKKGGEPFKSYSQGTAKWPVGVAEMGSRACVLLVEGGPDMLAAYHFLHRHRRLGQVAVVAVLGASVIIAEEALRFFDGKRVRIIVQNDDVKRKVTRRADGTESVIETCAGADAAARWTDQITAAGGAVECFSLAPLVALYGAAACIQEGAPACAAHKVGEPLNDLNELAMVSQQVQESTLVRDAFCEWKEGFGG
jgi:hypothetical protein